MAIKLIGAERVRGRRMNYNVRKVASAVDRIMPDPVDPTREMTKQKLSVMVGCCWEVPAIRPSYPEIAAAIGVSHTTCMAHLEYWHAFPWRDRYAWLVLVDARLAQDERPMEVELL